MPRLDKKEVIIKEKIMPQITQIIAKIKKGILIA